MSENSGLYILKLVRDDQVRRLRIKPSNFKFQTALDKTVEFFNLTNFQIAYKDDEDELITITNDMELAEAFQVAETDGRKSLRLLVIGGAHGTATANQKATSAFKNRHSATMSKLKTFAAPEKVSTPKKSSNHKQEEKVFKKTIIEKPSKPVPLEVTSGGAKLYLDGTVEFGLGGEASLRPDGTVSCILNGNGFPSVKCQDLSVNSGKWYYELHLLTSGCMQVGWVTPSYTGDASHGDGVGDDNKSWAYDGHRQLRWHHGDSESWGPKWKAGDTVCCTIDCDRGELRFALNGKWPSYNHSVCFNEINVKKIGGLTPAVSFSNGQKCRFNFGADGTPLSFSPPDSSFMPIWNAYGTMNNVASKPNNRRGMHHGEKKAADDNMNGIGANSAAAAAAAAVEAKKDAHLELLQLINRDSVRDSITIALSNPLVSKAIQEVMEKIVMIGMQKNNEQVLQDTLKKQFVTLLPIGMELIAKHPELISVLTILIQIMKENGIPLAPPSCSYRKYHHHHHSKSRVKGRHCSRANRDQNWRHDSIGEHLRRWSGKIVETATNVVNGVHEAATGAQAREKLDAENLKKAIEESVLQMQEDEDLSRAVSLSLSEAETSESDVAQISGTTESVQSVEKPFQGETKVNDQPVRIPANVVNIIPKPKARFIKDGEEGRHINLVPGQPFQHTWRLMNSGSSEWSNHVTVKCVGGDAIKGSEVSVDVPSGIKPNQTFDAKIDLIAPDVDGRYICYFRLHDHNARFGDRIWIDVTVVTPKNVKKEEPKKEVPKIEETSTKSLNQDDEEVSGALPLFTDDEEDEDNTMLNAAVDESLQTSANDLTDWDMVQDSMRAVSTTTATSGEVECETKNEIDTSIEVTPTAPPSFDVVTASDATDNVAADVDQLTDERIKNQLEKLVELGFSERAAATALVQCDGDLGGAVTVLLAASGRLG